MTDLTFCHLHMTHGDHLILDTFENPLNYVSGELSDEELEIPPHEVPPNPDDSDVLPSQVHPSYPYGNPTSLKHPAARPRKPTDFSSRALFNDLSCTGGGVNSALRWRDLALDLLLPVDREKEEASRALLARKMASGAAQNNNPGMPQPQPQQAEQRPEGSEGEEDEEGAEDDDEDEDDDEGSLDDEENPTDSENEPTLDV